MKRVALIAAVILGCLAPDAVSQTARSEGDSDAAATISTNAAIAVGEAITGTIDRNDDADWYAIDLGAGQTVQITLQSAPSNGLGDPYLEIRNAAGAVVAQNDDTEGLNSALLFSSPQAARYFISAGRLAFSARGAYVLTVAAQTCSTHTAAPAPHPRAPEARAILEEALTIVRTLRESDFDRPRLVVGIAAELGGLPGDQTMTPEIESAADRLDGGWVRLAEAHVRSGDQAGCVTLARAAMAANRAFGWPRVRDQIAIAKLQVATGDRDSAAATFRAAADHSVVSGQMNDNVLMLSILAGEQAASGFFADAVQSAERADTTRPPIDIASGISNASVASAWTEIARARVAAGDLSTALANLTTAKGFAVRSAPGRPVLVDIALLQFRAGDSAAARATMADAAAHVRGFSGNRERASGLARLALAQADIEDAAGAAQSLADATALLERVTNHRDRVVVLDQVALASRRIAGAEPARQFMQAGLVSARAISSPAIRSSALFRISDAYIRYDDPALARPIITEAAASVELVRDRRHRDSLKSSIANWQARSGDVETALSYARAIPDPASRAAALLHVARAILGEDDGAPEVANES